ncbi:hypothetical protein [Curtobacterium sp. ME-Dv--P-122a]|uniref:hypothetical protein n=1 Tax=Curtobacterium sp. ME-Dv--P-122a TaxID=3040286 RepID=UPI00254E2DCF|nr:hypothetical protein [Curtobacterium sp. ME-Dv--P-122a]
MNTSVKSALVAAATISLLLASGTAAEATQPREPRAAWGYYNKVVNKSKKSHHTGSQILASCGSRTSSMNCGLTKGRAATRTIGLEFGATRKWAAGKLNFSASRTQSVSVTCSRQRVPKGRMLVAYPVGNRYKYKIEKHMTGAGKDYVTGRSGWLYAFNPGSARVTCDIIRYR